MSKALPAAILLALSLAPLPASATEASGKPATAETAQKSAPVKVIAPVLATASVAASQPTGPGAPASVPAGAVPGNGLPLAQPGVQANPQIASADGAAGKPEAPAEAVVLAPLDLPKQDLWARIREGMRLAESNDALVSVHEAGFVRRSEDLKRTLERSRPFMHHIVEEVARRGMPLELALLPIIESSFNPEALSPAQAAGIWQFIPSTGRIYGLDQNHWYDGRRDIVAATKAALDHLQYLNRLFGDWELALAAYNCGEGCVGRALAKNRAQGLETRFSALALPAETRNYVPKLLAVRNILREPERYGLKLDSLPDEPYFQVVTLPRPLEARAAARLAGMNLDDFLDLNPGFRRKVIYSDAPSKLLIPRNKVALFNKSLERNAGEMNWLRKYLAQKGESLKQIAERFDVSLSWLRETNPVETGRKGQLKTATPMLVPATPGATGNVAAAGTPVGKALADSNTRVQASVSARHGKMAAKKAPTRVAKASTRRVHTVRKGDTLFDLAERYNVAVADIKALNGRLSVLRPGTRLRIPPGNG